MLKLSTLMRRHDATVKKYNEWWSCYSGCALSSPLRTFRMNLIKRVNHYSRLIREAMKTDTATPVPKKYLQHFSG